MNDDRMSDDDRVKRIGEILDALKDKTLSPQALARLERELEQYAWVRDPNAVGDVLPPDVLVLFAEELKQWQGTIFPDFEAVRRKKAELDRKFFEP